MIQTTNTTICKSWRGRNFVVKIWGGEIDILQSIWVESAILQNKGRKLPMYESLGTKSTNKKTFVAKTWNKKVDFWPNYKNTKLYLEGGSISCCFSKILEKLLPTLHQLDNFQSHVLFKKVTSCLHNTKRNVKVRIAYL